MTERVRLIKKPPEKCHELEARLSRATTSLICADMIDDYNRRKVEMGRYEEMIRVIKQEMRDLGCAGV